VTYTVTASPSASAAQSPCPNCAPIVNVTVPVNICNAAKIAKCGLNQCALDVNINFDYLTVPGGTVFASILATRDCITWWHTGSARDLTGYPSYGAVNVTDGCYGDGDEALAIVTCIGSVPVSGCSVRRVVHSAVPS
jgi:hypothetical protein